MRQKPRPSSEPAIIDPPSGDFHGGKRPSRLPVRHPLVNPSTPPSEPTAKKKRGNE